MKYYDQNGKVTTAAERRHTTDRYRETLFNRVLSPQPPGPPSTVSSHCRALLVSSSPVTCSAEDGSYRLSALRALSAHAAHRLHSRSAKLVRAKSAKLMANSRDSGASKRLTEVDGNGSSHRLSNGSSATNHSESEQTDSSTCADVIIKVDPPPGDEASTVSESSLGRARDNVNGITWIVDRAEEEKENEEGELKEEEEEEEEENTADEDDDARSQNGSAIVPSKKKIGLRIAVADFTKKIKDNEGMDISTYSYLEEPEIPDEGPSPDTGGMTEEERELSITSYLQYRSTLNNMTPGEKFRRAVKTITLLLRACTSHAEETKRRQKRLLTFADVSEDAEEPVIPETEALFDLSYYKARRERTISNEAKEIMRMHPSLRTEEQIQKVVMSLNSAVEAFGEFPLNMQYSLVRVGWYEKFGAKRVIIRQGQSALNFYFMICGITMVTVARHNRSTGESYAETVAFLKKGNSFGELALMYGGKRSATVSCKDEVELLAVAREDFVDIFMSMDADVEPEHVRYLRDIRFIKDWPIDELPYDDPSICLFTYFRRGTVLCRDNNTADWVYVVMTGRCRVIKDLRTKDPKIQRLKTKDRMLESLREEKDTQASRYYTFLHEDSSGKKRRHRHDSARTSESSQTSKRDLMASNKKIYIQLKILGPRDVFGLEAIAFELYGESNSVTFVSDGAECVLINRAFFVKHMSDRYLKMLRKELQPFPSADILEEKLQASSNWNAYREYLIDHLISRRQYSESMLY